MRVLVTVLGEHREHEWQLGQAGEQGADDNGITTLYACAVLYGGVRLEVAVSNTVSKCCNVASAFSFAAVVMSLNLAMAPPSR
jgi:hypothetical protein